MAKTMADLYEKYKTRTTFDDEKLGYTSTGSVIFDQTLSLGKGMPNGVWIQITGDSGSGKTHIVLQTARSICKTGKKVAYIDSEKGLNPSQLKGLGLSEYVGTKFFPYPITTFEEAEEVMDASLDDKDLGLIVIDSITALIPEKMLETSVAKIEPGLKARCTGQFMEKYRGKVSYTESKPSVILINQKRVKFTLWQASVQDAGGNAQKFYNDIRIQIQAKKKLEHTVETLNGKEKVQYGVENEIWAAKNRFAPPFVKLPITVLFGQGVSNLAAYKTVLMYLGVLKMSGAGFWKLKLPDQEEKGARGEDGCLDMIKANLSIIKPYIEANGGIGSVGTSDEDTSESIDFDDSADLEDLEALTLED